MKEIESAVVEVLNAGGEPLLARDIAAQISLKLMKTITKKEVNQFLYDNSFRFSKDEKHKWSVRKAHLPIAGQKTASIKLTIQNGDGAAKPQDPEHKHVIDTNFGERWNAYPIRIQGGSKSNCCNATTLLTQLLPGGFVTKDCSKCGNPEFLSKTEFFHEIDLWVSCPKCRQRMAQAMIKSNYGYECKHCEMGIWLAALLPRWEDIK